MSPVEMLTHELVAIDVLIGEWDECFAGVDLDADEVALEVATRLMREIERRQSALMLVLEMDFN